MTTETDNLAASGNTGIFPRSRRAARGWRLSSAWLRARGWAKRCLLPTIHALRRAAGPIRWENLRRTSPVTRRFGMDRGQPVDRYYIDRFLERHASDVCGDVLEVGEKTYTRRWGGARVTGCHVLHATEGNPEATIVGELASGRNIPADAFDCIILTQTLPFVYDIRGVVATCHRALRPGGALLATVAGISQISRYDMDRWGDYWRFTGLSAQRLFGEAFGDGNVRVQAYGNVLAAVCLLHGMAAEDVTPEELDVVDPDYEVTIAIRAVKRNPQCP